MSPGRDTTATPRTRRPRWLLPAAAFALSSCLATVAALATAIPPAAPDQSEARAGTAPAGMQVGVTHTQVSVGDRDGGRLASAERRLLARTPRPQNQHIMGWGAENPEPRPGVYDWGSLDRRMALIRQTGGTPIITLCCAPDWMKGGRPGQTDWSQLERAPDAEHYDDFADLAARVAGRYPDVTFFQVWNELKGFHDAERNVWDIAAYTRLYNKVHDAVKAVRPDAKIGGPYVPVDSWSRADQASHPSSLRGPWGVVDQRALDAMSYWLRHNAGADFVTLDMSTSTNDAGLTADPFTALGKVTTVIHWVRQRTDLPVWMSEWYPLPDGAPGDLHRQDAIVSASLRVMEDAGVAMALLWGPQRASPDACRACLWTTDGRTVEPTPVFDSIERFRAAHDARTRRVAAGRVTNREMYQHFKTAAHRDRVPAPTRGL